MSTIPEVMKSITQAEVNKACNSRAYNQIEDMLTRVKIEILVVEEELEEIRNAGQNPTRSQLFNLKVIKLNKERLENRILDLVTRSEKRSARIKSEREKMDLALALVKERSNETRVKKEINDAKHNNSLIDLKRADPMIASIAERYNAGISFEEQVAMLKSNEPTYAPLTTEEIAIREERDRKLMEDIAMSDKEKEQQRLKKEKKKADESIENQFKPNEDGSVEL